MSICLRSALEKEQRPGLSICKHHSLLIPKRDDSRFRTELKFSLALCKPTSWVVVDFVPFLPIQTAIIGLSSAFRET